MKNVLKSNVCVMKGIAEMRAKLYDLRDQPDFVKSEYMNRLANLYACLDVEGLIAQLEAQEKEKAA